ncbi:hypothetical protein FJMB80155_07880 [Escherichia coli]|nr:hypothetical protein FJMB80155_07880 [Escherichia coli]
MTHISMNMDYGYIEITYIKYFLVKRSIAQGSSNTRLAHNMSNYIHSPH